ncbi:maleylpyruvate isomerase family mycothiol-dependent enzyme [Cellulomonas sp. Y8]|uniref:maleylpyruvate isomerase family mycothiol-dependent enzyme n=1 Tax=Cellulomonas sp. Y8 TaxID=2591145 RepID=UPI0011CC857C
MTSWAPERYWSAIREERTRFAAELAALPPEAWSAPTLCGDWSVEDVVAHLTAGASTGAVGVAAQHRRRAVRRRPAQRATARRAPRPGARRHAGRLPVRRRLPGRAHG